MILIAMYHYRPTTDEQVEDKINNDKNKYKKYSYDEIKKIVEEKGDRIIQPQKPTNGKIKTIMKKNDKPNSANLFYNLFD